ncbi:chemotaxis protein CheA [Anaerovorax odorimutans]|uniref:Chemotaxis protein CheA n=1 Tax=Anaerovorax odorimutans TaxID=109327 RepID=A0ABT1RP13_9FIRM|nr:chemotaxis protein CheA [Anaerovorax odorimutans]MCQ4636934.1 chemotaxis protein CheA [Anaerovorax odorimutans]
MGYFDSDAEEMLQVYLLETRQLTGQLSTVLLDAEKNNCFTQEDIHSIFRVMHTIKSSSAMMGLTEMSSMAHKLEDLFAFYREQNGTVEQPKAELFDLLLDALDHMEDEMERMSQEDYAPKSTQEIEERAAAYLEKAAGEEIRLPESEETTEEEQGIPGGLEEKDGIVVRVVFEENCRMENIRAYMLVRQISGLCSCVETYPPNLEKAADGAEYINKNGVFIRFETQQEEDVLECLSKGLFVKNCEIVSQEEKPQRQELGQEEEKPAARQESRDAEFISVRSDRLDKLQNLTGEMVIQMLNLDSGLTEAGMDDLKEGTAYQINRLIYEMERTVMEIRLVPLEKLIPKLRRTLRDIGREQHKEIDLAVNCANIEADKSVVDLISEALIHLIRNAVDHGIGTPEERLAVGKKRRGTITFSVESMSGELLISVSDDGRGLDEEKILEKAREKGLLNKPAEAYGSDEICELILQPGFTTNQEVTAYSGRGVGLDVVKNTVEEIGGQLHIHSEAGEGSKFIITVPMTLATMECTRFQVGEYRFSLPSRYVFRFMDYRSNRENIRETNGRQYILYEDRMVPLIDLRKFYRMESSAPDSSIVIYVKNVEKEGCVLVDFMYTQKRVVVKPLPPLMGPDFRKRTGITGFGTMGDGVVCAALDPGLLISQYEREAVYDVQQ